MRPDLEFVDLRGNISTRLSKVPAGGAIVMAVAALEVLGLTDQVAQILDPNVVVPMIGQGCVAVECRVGDTATHGALVAIDHDVTRRAVEMERAFLAELGAGCNMPIGAHLDAQDVFTAFMATGDRASDRHVTLAQSVAGIDDRLQLARDIAMQCRSKLQ
jgi:hydroxymethylbilane synthase